MKEFDISISVPTNTKKDRDEVAILYSNKKMDDHQAIRFSYVETVCTPSLPV